MKLGGKSIAVLLLLAGLVFVNLLVSFFPARLDLTADRIYTLSDGTRAMLDKVEEPIALQFYFTRSTEGLPIMFKNYASRVEEMLRQYVAKSGGNVTLKVVDPQPDTDEETEARRVGLTAQQLRTGEQLYLGLVATQADEEKTIPYFDPQRESFLEYDISKLIYSVQQFDKPKLGLVSGLPLRGNPYASMMGQPPEPDQYVVKEWENTFEVVTVEESAEALPDDLDVLAVIHPQNLGEKLLFAIDQFLLGGKPVFVAVDPSSFFFRGQQRQQQMMMGGPQPNVSSNLPKLFAAWGINYDASSVVGDLDLASEVQTGSGTINFPIWLSLEKDDLSAEAQPTSALSNTLLPEAGSISVATDRGYEVTPLMRTSPRSGNVASMLLQYTPADQIMRSVRIDNTRKNLAVLVRGTFKSAFPEGAPKTPEPAEGSDGEKKEPVPAAPATPVAPALHESLAPGSLVIVADTDWMLDQFMFDPRFLRAGILVPSNDNLSFAANIMDFLGGSQDLIAIRGKGSSQREFEVIQQMQLAAQEKYQAQLQALEGRLSEVQQELNKLQSSQAEGKQLVATPEMSEALARYREQEAQMRSEIRKIRLSLREDVESLQNRLTVANVFAIPTLIIALGIVFTVRRHSRQKTS